MNKVYKKNSLITRVITRVQNKPARLITLSFFFVILVGSLLLTLPAASSTGVSHGFLKALFTATSATCVTGLVVLDTATSWTLFGQLVIIGLIQIGGLGLVTITTFFFTLFRRKMGLKTMVVAQECTSSFSLEEVRNLLRKIISVTLSIEAIGGIILSIRYIPVFGWAGGIYRGFFQGISAFCNAGFDLMGQYSGQYSSLVAWNKDPIVIITTGLLIIAGGLGFVVWSDMLNLNKQKGLNFHSKLVLKFTAILVFGGMIFFLIAEHNNTSPDSLGTLPPFQQAVAAFFQSVTTRTAGFNSISQSFLNESSKIMSSILMFIGASSGSTGGGIKITTFSVILFYIVSELRGNSELVMMKRRISRDTLSKSFIIATLSLGLVIIDVMLLTVFERDPLRHNIFTTLDLLFETVSAFGTVGLTSVGTNNLQPHSWVVLIITMFVGRVGPASFALALSGKTLTAKDKVYPEAKVLVG
ncbi:MAG: TrkH family potassium uptake protein [Saccharofermentanales bacterium]